METPEAQTIQAIQAGELNRFTDLYDQYVRRIYDFIYYRTHHVQTAEDLASQTFVKALERIGQFDPARGTFSAWLYRIARNTVIDHYRAHRDTAELNDAWDIPDTSALPVDLDVRQTLSQVREYLGKLTAEQRDLVVMRVWDGLSYAEIAAITGKSEASLKMAFSRTIGRLRSEFPAAAALLAIFALLDI